MKNIERTVRLLRIGVASLFMVAMIAAFSGFCTWLAVALPQVQSGPAILKWLTEFSIGALITLIVIALATFCFGRFYCAMFCPFGILQDLIGSLSRRKGNVAPNFRKIRYVICGVALGMILLGWNAPFLLFDPYSNFGRIAGSVTVGGLIPLIVILFLAIWKKRIYCTMVCPVGTLLGVLAKYGIFRLQLTEHCVKCGQCVKVCPVGCIEPEAGTVDNERCVRCMNCLAVCRFNAVRFGRPEKERPVFDGARRAFLVNGGVLIAGMAAGLALARTGMGKLAEYAKRFAILPPGAGNAERFAAQCTSCQLCTVNCPSKIIVPAPEGYGPVSLDLSRGVCRYDCNKCSQVCPTGAIRHITLETKQKLKIAEAKFNPRVCIVFQDGEKCGKCANACPTGAITLRKSGAPYPVNTALCIGCGACQNVCPVPGKAMTVHEIEQQIVLEA